MRRVFRFQNRFSLGSILQRGTARICHRSRKAGFSHELHWHHDKIRREKNGSRSLRQEPRSPRAMVCGVGGHHSTRTLSASLAIRPKNSTRLDTHHKTKTQGQSHSHHRPHRRQGSHCVAVISAITSDEQTAYTQLRTWTVLVRNFVYMAVVKDQKLRNPRKGFTTRLHVCVLRCRPNYIRCTVSSRRTEYCVGCFENRAVEPRTPIYAYQR